MPASATGRHNHERPGAHRSGLSARLVGWLHPHAHDHVEQAATTTERSSEGVRVTKLTLVLLVGTSAVQLAIVLASGSVALFADTVHNLADGLTSLPLWIALLLGRRVPTRAYPYGYRRAEDLAGVLIVLVIAVSAVLIGAESVGRLLEPRPVTHLGWVLLAGLVGVVGNEIAAIARIRVGRRIGSAALVADGYHARTDTLGSLAVVAAAVGTWIGYPIVDPLVGLLITALIGWMLVQTARPVLRRLMDGVEPALLDRIEAAAAQVSAVQTVDWARARWSGHRLHAELAVAVDETLTVADGHAVGEDVRRTLAQALPQVEHAVVHIHPGAGNDSPRRPAEAATADAQPDG
jgi:cation diffusion facilitator family transporter